MALFTELYNTVEIWYYSHSYPRYILWSVCAVAILGGSYAGFTMWRSRLDQRATTAIHDALVEYNTALAAATQPGTAQKDIDHLFENVARDMELGHNKYGYSSLAPFFKVLQADALSHLGKHEESYAAIKNVYRSFSASSPYYIIFGIAEAERALALPEHQSEGLKLLQDLAASSNALQDLAQYKLAEHLLAKGEKAQAKELLLKITEAAQKLDPQMVSEVDQRAAYLLETIV